MSQASTFRITYWGTTGTIAAPLRPGEVTEKLVQVLLELGRRGELAAGPLDETAVRQYLDTLPFHLRSTYGGNTTCAEVQTDDAGHPAGVDLHHDDAAVGQDDRPLGKSQPVGDDASVLHQSCVIRDANPGARRSPARRRRYSGGSCRSEVASGGLAQDAVHLRTADRAGALSRTTAVGRLDLFTFEVALLTALHAVPVEGCHGHSLAHLRREQVDPR